MIRNDTTPDARRLLAGAVGEGLEQLEPPLAEELLPEVRATQRTIAGDMPQPVIDLALVTLRPVSTGGQRRIHEVQLDVISDKTTDADDGLDALCSAVLDVLGELGIAWSTADRVVRDNHPAYRITLTLETRP